VGGRSEKVDKKNRCGDTGIANERVDEMNTIWLILLTTITIINIIANFAVKFNDVKHIEEDVKKIWAEVKELKKETMEQGERISRIEGRLNGS